MAYVTSYVAVITYPCFTRSDNQAPSVAWSRTLIGFDIYKKFMDPH